MNWHPDIPEEYRNQIVTGDARELAKQIPDESIDLIFTDPPYLKEYLHLYKWLSQISKRILKNDGFLFAYSGGYWKQTAMLNLASHMEYFYDFILVHRGNTTILWPKHIISRYKSILAYRKNGSKAIPRTNVIGVIQGMGPDKRFHKWGQDIHSARYLINCFSKKGDVILDLMVGAGTTAEACIQLDRNYVAFEIDPEMADVARDRISNTQPLLFTLDPEQLNFDEEIM